MEHPVNGNDPVTTSNRVSPPVSNWLNATTIFPERNAFTLIEMLVVISIIAVLVALSFPVLSSIRKKGYQAACVSNIRQALTATLLAANDNGGRYPNMHGYSWEQGETWIADTLAPYFGGTVGKDPNKVLRCPAAERNPQEAWLEDSRYCHYRYNIWHAQNQMPLLGPTNAMVFFDTAWPDWKRTDFAHSPGQSAFLNVAYADGHVTALSFVDYQKQSTGDEAQSDFFALGWSK